MTEAHGSPEPMRQASIYFEHPPFADALSRYPIQACDGGLAECAGLAGADQSSTLLLQQFITQASQGFQDFQSVVRQCADLYENSRTAATAQLESVINQATDPGLADRAKVFVEPKPAPGR